MAFDLRWFEIKKVPGPKQKRESWYGKRLE